MDVKLAALVVLISVICVVNAKPMDVFRKYLSFLHLWNVKTSFLRIFTNDFFSSISYQRGKYTILWNILNTLHFKHFLITSFFQTEFEEQLDMQTFFEIHYTRQKNPNLPWQGTNVFTGTSVVQDQFCRQKDI